MKTIVITGGSDGLGKALAEKLSQNHKVIILARNETAMKAIAAQTGCAYFVCDVRDPKQVTDVFKHIPHIDVLMNNAGITVNGELTDTADAAIADVITTNTIGSIYVAKAALKIMKPQKSGLIINVVSQSGLATKPNRSIYNASKWAMTGFTKALQEEVAPYGVRVTGFYPGTIATNLFAKHGLEIRTTALTTAQVVKTLEFVIDTDPTMLIPELGVKHI